VRRLQLIDVMSRSPTTAVLLGVLLYSGTEAQEAPLPAPPVVSEILAAQVMLDRAGFSPGEIDGRRGRNFARALTAFQRTHALPPSGDIDDATWKVLSDRTGGQQPLISYEITSQDLAGPFVDAIPGDLMKQAELDALGYTSALEMLAEKFHVSPRLLQEANRHATFRRAGERILVPNIAAIDPLAPLPGSRPVARIVVAQSTSALTVEDASGHLLFHAPVTIGSGRDPLPIGSWKVTGVQRMPPFHYNPALFWDANPSHAKARIAPGPNNPVGTLWIDLTREHYGIHGTPEPSRIGHVQSHGCVRLTNWDANRVSLWARPGTEVEFR
jgi:lipoprotein-anchoring transpeptidase ErfK/SrfK